MAWRRGKNANEGQEEAMAHAFAAIRTLIATRLNPPSCMQTMRATGLDANLAVRYLDLAMVVAAREQLDDYGGVVLPDDYRPTIQIDGYPARFSECPITAALLSVYEQEPTASTLLGPLSSDYVAIAQELKEAPDATLGLPSPIVGDGSQIGFARLAFGDNAVLKLASSWPKLA